MSWMNNHMYVMFRDKVIYIDKFNNFAPFLFSIQGIFRLQIVPIPDKVNKSHYSHFSPQYSMSRTIKLKVENNLFGVLFCKSLPFVLLIYFSSRKVFKYFPCAVDDTYCYINLTLFEICLQQSCLIVQRPVSLPRS